MAEMDVADFEPLEPSLKNVIDQKSLRWIFVGGNGGVGKTTCSCSLAVQLSKVRKSVLIITTDPATNLFSEIPNALNQKFSKVPTKVNGFENLFAVVVHPSEVVTKPFFLANLCTPPYDEYIEGETEAMGLVNVVADEILGAIPGLFEVERYAEILKLIKSMNFSAVVFDTAPTGHTLRLLCKLSSYPGVFEGGLGAITRFALAHFAETLNQSSPPLSLPAFTSEMLCNKMDAMLSDVRQVDTLLKDPNHTTFVCVCTTECLSLDATEALVQEIAGCGMDVHNIIVNKVLPRTPVHCALCSARLQEQKQQLERIADLHRYFHVTKVPLSNKEVRGAAAVGSFSELLLEPYVSPAWNEFS